MISSTILCLNEDDGSYLHMARAAVIIVIQKEQLHIKPDEIMSKTVRIYLQEMTERTTSCLLDSSNHINISVLCGPWLIPKGLKSYLGLSIPLYWTGKVMIR